MKGTVSVNIYVFQFGELKKVSGDIIRATIPYRRGICVPDSCSNDEVEEMLVATSNPYYMKTLSECHRMERDEFTNADIAMM